MRKAFFTALALFAFSAVPMVAQEVSVQGFVGYDDVTADERELGYSVGLLGQLGPNLLSLDVGVDEANRGGLTLGYGRDFGLPVDVAAFVNTGSLDDLASPDRLGLGVYRGLSDFRVALRYLYDLDDGELADEETDEAGMDGDDMSGGREHRLELGVSWRLPF